MMTSTLSPLRAALTVGLIVGLVIFLEQRIQASLFDGHDHLQWLTPLVVALPAGLLGIGWRQRRFERGSLLHAINLGLVMVIVITISRPLADSPWLLLLACIGITGIAGFVLGNSFYRMQVPPPEAVS